MELILERGLPHQQKAVCAVVGVFDGATLADAPSPTANPIFDRNDEQIKSNIRRLQAGFSRDRLQNENPDNGEYLNIDIKMETGTGKTYVYTATMYELKKKYGFNKFIVIVPSIAIKVGAKQFMSDPYVQKHFADVCGYNCNIELKVLESEKGKKSGRTVYPHAVREFVAGTQQNQNKIYVLLMNAQFLTNRTKTTKNGKTPQSTAMLFRDDYDIFVENCLSPIDALCQTRPIVIIDEPHRFSRDNKAYGEIAQRLKPQMIIRYGATFPQSSIGSGKNKRTFTDYNNLVYELNACDAFNQGLIKQFTGNILEDASPNPAKIRIGAIENDRFVKFVHIRKNASTVTHTISKGESLGAIDAALSDITIESIGRGKFLWSLDEAEHHTGEEFSVDAYSEQHQRTILQAALDLHFETERQNFNRKYKIKTLALFFIDDISSYREMEDKPTYLKDAFEEILREKINVLLPQLNDDEWEYKEYLKATLKDIPASHAGYFSQDNSSSDADIEKEVDDILRNKKGLLSIKKESGQYNTRRFLFSKWTLKEGWDNPNVFTIAKLRTSGSENSKLQEVGRGLRLPVDESGNRISNEDFTLNYVVDFTESDFTEKLRAEINKDLPTALTKLSPEKIEEIAAAINCNANKLFAKWLNAEYIDLRYNILPEKREEFAAEVPSIKQGLQNGKVTERKIGDKPEDTVHIRKEQFNKLKDFWQQINQKYYLLIDESFNKKIADELPKIIINTIKNALGYASLRREKLSAKDSELTVSEENGRQYRIDRKILYHEFLKNINRRTAIPLRILHNAFVAANKEQAITPDMINEQFAMQIVRAVKAWKTQNLTTILFSYKASAQTVGKTALTKSDGTPQETVKRSLIGVNIDTERTPIQKYLYDKIAYDSPLERENITESNIDEVTVYGKIPKTSIAIPTLTGETYSPDFMYVVRYKDGQTEINIVVETKAVDNDDDLREKEQAKIKCAEEFFKLLTVNGYKVNFRKQKNDEKIRSLIDNIIKNQN